MRIVNRYRRRHDVRHDVNRGYLLGLKVAALELARMVPLNAELRPDGSEDPEMASYVEGLRDAHDTINGLIAKAIEGDQ